jgi:hypothetical protein
MAIGTFIKAFSEFNPAFRAKHSPKPGFALRLETIISSVWKISSGMTDSWSAPPGRDHLGPQSY